MNIEINDKIINACKTNRPLIALLCQKGSGRYSKVEAYLDLMDRMATDSGIVTSGSEPACLMRGEFLVTITELAAKWNWHRATVRSFLDSLEEIGEIKKELLNHCYRVQMVHHVNIVVPYVGPNDILSAAKSIYHASLWQGYDMSGTAEFLLQYILILAKVNGNGKDVSPDKHLVLETVRDVCKDEFTSAGVDVEKELPEELFHEVCDTLESSSSWTLQKWLQASRLLLRACQEHEQPNLRLSDESLLTEADLPLLGKLYVFYTQNNSDTKQNEPSREIPSAGKLNGNKADR